MSQWLWISIGLISMGTWAVTPDRLPRSSTGPTLPSEMTLLWDLGRKAFDEKKYEESALHFERLLHRYPSNPHFAEANLWLGKTRLAQKEPQKAIAPLKSAIVAFGKSKEGLQARLVLGKAYLESKKFSEAYLTALEVLAAKEAERLPALLLKAHALIGLNQDERALKVVSTIEADSRNHPENNSDTAFLKLRLKTRECERWPQKFAALDEAQTRRAMERKGGCLLEASLYFFETLRGSDAPLSDKATLTLSGGFKNFWHTCQNPPAPPGQRTQKQITRFRQELQEILKKDCATFQPKAKSLLESFIPKLPEPKKEWIERALKTVLDASHS